MLPGKMYLYGYNVIIKSLHFWVDLYLTIGRFDSFCFTKVNKDLLSFCKSRDTDLLLGSVCSWATVNLTINVTHVVFGDVSFGNDSMDTSIFILYL